MAGKDAEGGDRVRDELWQSAGTRQHLCGFLPKPEQLRSQFVFHLGTIERPVDFNFSNDICAEEDTTMSFHVVKLHREAVSCAADFAFGEQKRRGIVLV